MEELAPEHKAQYDAVAATEVTTAFFLATCRSGLQTSVSYLRSHRHQGVEPLSADISCVAGAFLQCFRSLLLSGRLWVTYVMSYAPGQVDRCRQPAGCGQLLRGVGRLQR